MYLSLWREDFIIIDVEKFNITFEHMMQVKINEIYGQFEFFEVDVMDVPSDILEEGVELWKDHLVGFFVDKRLPFPVVKSILEKQWKTKASYEISTNKDVFYFKFVLEEDRKLALESGPLFMAGRVFMIQPWTEELEFQRRNMTTQPIWVKIWDIPKQMWT
ncbi:hypothetical protein IFM89_011072 [Coptis chinensis]|uniref:DUF4283 domain-containing protein n=1 Tax=Coptis chinensis TaxID=261450 RepID=A0A835IPJ4_9MAGN|nr:hypothetical protein IFM89_011072 [Coptis chinensis]